MDKSEYDGSDKKDDNNRADGNETGGNTSSPVTYLHRTADFQEKGNRTTCWKEQAEVG